jgi:putative endonuclease
LPDAELWYVYVLTSAVRAITYVGCTNDVTRRVRQHNGELVGGARFTQRWRPWALAAVYGPFCGRGDAQRAEYRVKRLRGEKRLTAGFPRA